MHQESVNDETVTILKHHFSTGDRVKTGDVVIDVETSKAVLEIDADVNGFIDYRCKVGEELKKGNLLFVLFDEWNEQNHAGTSDETAKVSDESHEVIYAVFSRKALALIRKNHLSKEMFQGRDIVTDQDVLSLLHKPNEDLGGRKEEENINTNFSANREDTPSDAYGPMVQMENLSPSKKTEIKYLSKVQAAGMNSSLHLNVEVADLFSHTNRFFHQLKNSLLPIVVYETARLLSQYRELNAFYVDDRIAYYNRVNIGVAVDIDDGLKVLTLPDTNRLMPRQIEAMIMERIDLYLDRKLKPDHITGSTFTISDLSSQHLSFFQPLINKNQSAILGISGVDGKLQRVTFSLVFDHRVTEGMRAGQFLNELKERVESYAPNANSPNESKIVTAGPAQTKSDDSFDVQVISCHRCMKSLEEDAALSGPGLLKIVLPDGRQAALCRDCLLGF